LVRICSGSGPQRSRCFRLILLVVDLMDATRRLPRPLVRRRRCRCGSSRGVDLVLLDREKLVRADLVAPTLVVGFDRLGGRRIDQLMAQSVSESEFRQSSAWHGHAGESPFVLPTEVFLRAPSPLVDYLEVLPPVVLEHVHS
jgi:hypothetical protein